MHDCPTCGDADCACTRCRDCLATTTDYEASPRDEKVTPSAGLCEECHMAEVRAVRRERVRLVEEGRGDWERDARR